MTTTRDDAVKLADALAYAAKGYFILPFSPPPDEGPLVPIDTASREPEQICAWWQRWPNANVGCPHDKNDLVMIEVKGGQAQRLAKRLVPRTTAVSQVEDWTRYYYRTKDKFKSRSFLNGTVNIYGSDAVHALPPLKQKRAGSSI